MLKLTTGLFRRVCLEVAADHPDVTVDDFHIAAMTTRLVRKADVIVTENILGHPRDGAGRPRFGARHRRAERGEPDRDGALQRDAAGVAGREERQRTPARRRRARGNGVTATVSAGTSTRDLGGSASTTEFTAISAGKEPS